MSSRFFSDSEITATGARVEDVSPRLLSALDVVRESINRPIHLLHNGLTTGNHNSRLHASGEAVDFTVRGCDSALAWLIASAGIMAGFRGIGIYCNFSGVHSFHFDLRDNFASWHGYKNADDRDWRFTKITLGRG